MTILQVQHTVRDFDAWKQSFDSDPVGREQGSVRRYRILRGADHPNFVVIELEFDGSAERRLSARSYEGSGVGLVTTSASRARRREFSNP